jgi:biotin operon repressor
MKTYFNIMQTMNVWQVIDDLQAIGLEIKAVTAQSITVAAKNGFTIAQIDDLMANRGYI